MNGKTKFMWAVTLYHTQNTHGHWQVRMSFDACNHGLNTSFRLFCLFVTKEILYSIIAGSDHGSYAKPLLLHVFLTPRQALSSHPHQQMVWMYWLQDRDSMPNWYTISTILQHCTHTMKPSDPLLLTNGTLRCGMYPTCKVAISWHLATLGFPHTVGKLSADACWFNV